VYVFEGDAVLVRAGVALLVRREMELLGAKTVEEVRGVLFSSREKGKGMTTTGGKGGEEERWIRGVREAGKA